MIPAGFEVWRGYSFKRFAVESVPTTFCNRHDWLVPFGATRTDLESQLNFQTVAEQHTLRNSVTIPWRVMLPCTVGQQLGKNMAAMAVFHQVGGGGAGTGIDAAVEWPIMFVMRKHAEWGRSGRVGFFGAVRKRDVRTDEKGRVYLPGGWNPPNLQRQYFNAYMTQGPFRPCIAPSQPGNFIPDSARIITHYGSESVIRLTSTPDAQKRKTPSGLSYRKKCHDWVPLMQDAGYDYRRMCWQFGAQVDKPQIRNFRTRFQRCVIAWNDIKQYYDNGLDPELAAKWRPTAGHDPFIGEAIDISAGMVEVMEKFAEEIEEVLAEPTVNIPATRLRELEFRTWQMAGHYALFFERERFTGNPIPFNV